MIRPSLRSLLFVPFLALAFSFISPQGGFEFGPKPAAADLLQCMESCIRHEGGNTAANKETCKMRCANVPSVTGGGASPTAIPAVACRLIRTARKTAAKRIRNASGSARRL